LWRIFRKGAEVRYPPVFVKKGKKKKNRVFGSAKSGAEKVLNEEKSSKKPQGCIVKAPKKTPISLEKRGDKEPVVEKRKGKGSEGVGRHGEVPAWPKKAETTKNSFQSKAKAGVIDRVRKRNESRGGRTDVFERSVGGCQIKEK